MPYIPKAERVEAEYEPKTVGELTFAIDMLLDRYVARRCELEGLGAYDYALLAEALGAIEAAKLEFVRRVVSPYEDSKITENGDIFVTAVLDRRKAGR